MNSSRNLLELDTPLCDSGAEYTSSEKGYPFMCNRMLYNQEGSKVD